MSDKRITDLIALPQANINVADEFELVDKSDTSMAPTGTNKRFTWGSIVGRITEVLADVFAPSVHASQHENGGSDEINVADLSGVLADAQTPAVHDNDAHDPDFATTQALSDHEADTENPHEVTAAQAGADEAGTAASMPGGTDSGTIEALTEKESPVDDDVVLIEDSEDTFSKKKVRVANLGGGGVSVISGPVYPFLGLGSSAGARQPTTDSTHVYIPRDVSSVLQIWRYKIVNGSLVSDSGNASSPAWVSDDDKNSLLGIASLGDYIYGWAIDELDTNTYKLYRWAKSDGSVTAMTISGTAPGQADHSVTTDGTNLYIFQESTSDLEVYSVSGTTATFVETITLPDLTSRGLTTDGTNIWFVSPNSGATANENLYKCDMDGGNETNRFLFEIDTSGHEAFLFIYSGYVEMCIKVTQTDEEYFGIIPIEEIS